MLGNQGRAPFGVDQNRQEVHPGVIGINRPVGVIVLQGCFSGLFSMRVLLMGRGSRPSASV